MDKQKNYYNKIKLFIIWTILISQTFICITVLYSYINFKFKNYRELSESQYTYYVKAMNSLSSKIDSMLYIFEDSGIISFCRDDYVFKDKEFIDNLYSEVTTNFNCSELSKRYFSDFYIIGDSANFSLAYHNGTLSLPNDYILDSSVLMNFDHPNGFNTNYQKIFRFDKTMLKNMRIDEYTKESYDSFFDSIDKKYIYSTHHGGVLCVLAFNDNVFNNIFETAEIYNTSVILKNSYGDILYSSTKNNDTNISDDKYTVTSSRYTLTVKPHITVSKIDFIFILLMLLMCGFIVFIIIHYSDTYASKIMEPYQILNNFFRLNRNISEFDLSEFSSSIRKRTVIVKIFFRAYFYTIFIPSLISLSLSAVILNFSTRHFSENNVAITHSHLINEFYDNFDFFIANNISETKNSRFNYTVTLTPENTLQSHPFETVTYSNMQQFNKTLELIKPNLKSGTLINIPNDLFGEKAIGIIKNTGENNILINVIKSESINNITYYNSVNFILSDKNKNIITNSPSANTDIEECISDINNRFLRTYSFDEFDWTLYTFINSREINQQVNRIIHLSFLIIALFLLIFSLITWYSSISFTHPIEYIILSISNFRTGKHQPANNMPYNNEIEELLSVYNQMLLRIEKISEENFSIMREKEHLNTLKIQSELNALQHQINPHFLYNTLQSISLNIATYNTNEIMKITSSLSDIYRYATNSENSFFLYDEFENLRNYTYIWSALFPGRFEIIYDIDPHAEIVPSLKLILQPIVENSFIYAFKNKTDNCKISIKAITDEDFVTVTIKDNGCGIAPEDLKVLIEKIKNPDSVTDRKGIGIRNVYQRLKLYYNDSFDFNIESTIDEGTTVTLKFCVYRDL